MPAEQAASARSAVANKPAGNATGSSTAPSGYTGTDENTVKVLFVGDIMLDRGVRSVINTRGFDYVFGPATTTFSQHDTVIGNLEGSITRYPSKLVLPNNKAIPGFQFTFSDKTGPALKDAGIDVVSLANNHALDFGQDGLNQTRANLSAAGVQFFGSYMNSVMVSTTTCPRADFCIGLVGWNEFGFANDQRIIEEIRALRPSVQYLVVYPHWGLEYKAQPTAKQRSLAQAWADAGADAVIGGHAHTVQRIEQYAAMNADANGQMAEEQTTNGRAVPIFYSLGNFIFDQYFSFDTTHGIALSIEFKKEKGAYAAPRYSVIPFSSIGSRVSIPTEANRARLLKNIENISASGTRSWLEFR
ncbi:MAG TPA: CapA family protein [Candidatus Paceibacterota bacterium]